MSGGVAVLSTSYHRECSVLDGYHKVIVKAGGLARPRLLMRLEAEVYIVSVHNAAMGDEKFVTFLKDVYTTYTGKVANTEGIINLLRSHDDGAEIERLVGFFFE